MTTETMSKEQTDLAGKGGQDALRAAVMSLVSFIKRLFPAKENPDAAFFKAVVKAYSRWILSDPAYQAPSDNTVKAFCDSYARKMKSCLDQLNTLRSFRQYNLPEPIKRMFWDEDETPNIGMIANKIAKQASIEKSLQSFQKKTKDVNIQTIVETGFIQ